MARLTASPVTHVVAKREVERDDLVPLLSQLTCHD
jgi:hypothetical protein